MSVHLERAQLLLGQNRYEQAEQELGRLLIDDAQNSTAHSLMSFCLLAREKFEAASQHAAEAVRLDPDNDIAHAAAAHVWLARNYLDRAETAARAAIALDPFDADWQSLLSSILFQAQKWPAALEAAQAALAIDPEHVDALNLQAAALRQLGRTSEAQGSLREALQQNPDEAWTHANLGWTCLQQGRQNEAERHFREALRLDPELEIARKGIVEAIKAKNRIYRGILRGFLWLSRRTKQGQWYLILGAFVGYRVVLKLAEEYPRFGWLFWPLVGLYISVVVISWFTTPLSNLALRLHPLGKLALSRDERMASNWVGGSLGMALVAALIWWFSGDSLARIIATMCAFFSIPLAMVFSCSQPGARRWMLRYTMAVAALGAVTVSILVAVTVLPDSVQRSVIRAPAIHSGIVALASNCWILFDLGCLLSVWAVNIAKSVAWKR